MMKKNNKHILLFAESVSCFYLQTLARHVMNLHAKFATGTAEGDTLNDGEVRACDSCG